MLLRLREDGLHPSDVLTGQGWWTPQYSLTQIQLHAVFLRDGWLLKLWPTAPCLSDSGMHQLPQEVLEEFQQGNFVDKRSSQKLSLEDRDHSLGWLNDIGKWCMTWITNTASNLSRWALSRNYRSQIAADTCAMSHMSQEDGFTISEAKTFDQEDDTSLLSTLQQFNVFSVDVHPSSLHNITAMDRATDTIHDSIMDAREPREQPDDALVEDKLVVNIGLYNHQQFHSMIQYDGTVL